MIWLILYQCTFETLSFTVAISFRKQDPVLSHHTNHMDDSSFLKLVCVMPGIEDVADGAVGNEVAQPSTYQ